MSNHTGIVVMVASLRTVLLLLLLSEQDKLLMVPSAAEMEDTHTVAELCCRTVD